MAYTFDPIFAADPSNAANVAANAAILIYDPNDAGKAPVTITDLTGSPLPNPVTVNKNGFGSAFQHATLDRLAWSGAGFEGFFTSYEGMKNVALAAQAAAETAASTAAAEAAEGVAPVVAEAEAAADAAAAAQAAAASSATAAANSAALVGAPADTAIAAAINGSATATKAALSATYALKGEASVGGVATSIASADKFRLGVLSADLATPTYDGSGAAVHPSVLYFPQGWNGHRYWMAMTPYPASNNKLENPSILVSNDGNTWSVPAGVTNPLVPAPAGTDYNSDTHLAMGPDGRMYLMFRQFIGSQDELCIMSTADGVTWTAPVVVMSNASAVRRLLSPAFWWDGGNDEWVMLAVDIVGTQRVVRSTAAAITGPWATPVDVTLAAGLPAGRVPWHLDAKDVGGTIIALIQDGSSAGGNLYFGVSGDQGKTLKIAPNMVANNAYRSSFVPLFTESGIILDTWVGYLNGDIKRGTAAVPALTADDFIHPIVPAAQGVKPYVLGDNFNRADNTASLGTASTGQAYTVWGGTPGIIGNKAYTSTAANTKVAIDTALANGVATLDLDFVGDADQAWLIFRGTDTNNYWSAGRRNNEYRLLKTVAGTQTIVYQSPVAAFVPGATVKAEYNGTTIKFYADNVLLHTATDTTHQTATFVGWQAFVVATRLDNLTCRKITA